MRYGIPACLGLIVVNVALFLVYNKADGEWPAVLIGALTLLAAVVGVATVVAERFRGRALRDLGWGLLGGSAGTVLLGLAFYVWLVKTMS